MIITKEVLINDDFSVEITFHENGKIRLYQLYFIGGEHELIFDSFNRDRFLLEANKVVKISNDLECLIASY